MFSGVEYARVNNYIVYQFNNQNACPYFLCIPTNNQKAYELFIGFPQKDLKYLPKKEVIEQIDEINKMITTINHNGIYILPIIDKKELTEAANRNDSKKFNEILQTKIMPITTDVYQRLTSYDSADKTVKQVINFVKQNEIDETFVDWLEMNMGNFAYGVTYDEIKKHYYERVSKEIEITNSKEEVMEDPTKEKITDDLQEDIQQNRKESFYYQENLESNSLSHTNSNVKVRKLTKPNNYGFANIFKISILLLSLISISVVLGLFIIE